MNRFLGSLIGSSAFLLILSGCSNETPFIGEGDGTLHMNTEVRSDINVVTRGAVAGYEDDYLNDNLVVYIENSKGVIRKYLGYDQIPEAISLPVGTYVVEGWTGDSVSASFDKKFFRGFNNKVTVDAGNNEMSLKLDIANVVVQVDPQVLEQGITDLKVTFYHSRAQLEFGEKEVKEGKRGYFMMPNDDQNLNYTIEGKNALGESFSKTSEIVDVQRAHLYNLKVTSDPVENNTGGGLIKLVIEDIPVIEERFEILPAPYFKATYGQDVLDLERQISSTSEPKDFNDTRVRALAYGNMEELKINFDSKILQQIPGLANVSDVNLLDNANIRDLTNNNIELLIDNPKEEQSSVSGNNTLKVVEAWITFKADFLNNLTPNDSEYLIGFEAKDSRGYVGTSTLRIANSDAALADPVISEETPDANKSPMAILANSAELTLTLLDDKVQDYGIMYRESNTEDGYIKVSALGTRSEISTRAAKKQYTVKLTGLKENTTYEYKVYADEFVETGSRTFTTEGYFSIPNGNMESWHTASGILEPSPSSNLHEYWDTGNHGSSALNKTLTSNVTHMKSSGMYGAELKSQFVALVGSLGKFAAGNLFVGKYARTDGTDGVIDFGREYNESHPKSVKVMVNYRPAAVESKAADNTHLKAGDTDEGQIYIALTTDIITVSTKDKTSLFEVQKETDKVIAYGEYNFTDNYGDENSLKELVIDFKYKEIAKTVKPKYLVIVCSASKYGDYFTGGEGSTMYVDDFELVYGDIQWQ